MAERSDYYVYVYIDPRNFEEFYFGKGCEGRKEAHLDAVGESNKAARIAAIRREKEEPIIRVLAKDLTQAEAFLIETTLIWRSTGNLSNVVRGHFCGKFRPHNKLHVRLPGFDFQHDIFYVNVAESVHRCWNDCRKFGFLAAGSGRRWSEQLERLNVGDVVAAYCRGHGFVGVGIVTSRAVRASQFLYNGSRLKKSILERPLLLENSTNPELAQYLVGIKWKATVGDVEEGKFLPKSGLYTPHRTVASLAAQPGTQKFIEESFGVSLDKLALGEK